MEIINKKIFAMAALNVDNKIFVIYIVALIEPTIISIYPFF